jgi:predicted house-cleaning NTP pyrophosphatase (Maf/HAM1 superfamily)
VSSASSASRLILASASPRRHELLAQLGVPFTVVTAEVTEFEDPAAEPRALVAHNAALKADWVAARHPEAISGGCQGAPIRSSPAWRSGTARPACSGTPRRRAK